MLRAANVLDEAIEQRAVLYDLDAVAVVDCTFCETDESRQHRFDVRFASHVEVRLHPTAIRRP